MDRWPDPNQMPAPFQPANPRICAAVSCLSTKHKESVIICGDRINYNSSTCSTSCSTFTIHSTQYTKLASFNCDSVTYGCSNSLTKFSLHTDTTHKLLWKLCHNRMYRLFHVFSRVIMHP